jgi:hypothetical protein
VLHPKLNWHVSPRLLRGWQVVSQKSATAHWLDDESQGEPRAVSGAQIAWSSAKEQ